MIGKKKYTQAELDAAVMAASVKTSLAVRMSVEAERDAGALHDRIALVRRILGQAPEDLIYTAAFRKDGEVTHHAIHVYDLRIVLAELEKRGYRP